MDDSFADCFTRSWSQAGERPHEVRQSIRGEREKDAVPHREDRGEWVGDFLCRALISENGL